MPLGQVNVESRIITLLRQFSGKDEVHLNHMVNKDLGIDGWDGIDIIEIIEETFRLDLRPLIDSVTTFLPPTWWDKLLGRKHGAPVADITVRDLIDYVSRNAGTASTASLEVP